MPTKFCDKIDRVGCRLLLTANGISLADLSRGTGIKYRKISGFFCGYWGMSDANLTSIGDYFFKKTGMTPKDWVASKNTLGGNQYRFLKGDK